METSDSEYFESADESFDSDHEKEIEKHKHNAGQNLGEKNIKKPLLAAVQSKVQKNVEERHREKIINTDKLRGISEDCSNSQNLNKNKKDLNERHTVENTKILKKQSEGEAHKNTSITEITEMTYTDLDKLAEQQIQPTHTDLDSNIQDDVKETIVKTDKNNDIKNEEDLWNDEELDWASEAVKEKSHKIEEPTSVSKTEDSGWDDFDAEWESESTVLSAKSSESKNKPVSSDDDWETLEKPEDKVKHADEQSSWGGWGNWGVSSLLSTATQGVSTLTSHVSQGLSTVLESGIGIPDPEEMARINNTHKNKDVKEEPTKDELKKLDDSTVFGLNNLVSGMSQLTKFVESTGTKVITGGLDTLEAIGKKTVEVLQEGDPGLKKKKAFLKLDQGKPNLSQILREAKEKTEKENLNMDLNYTQGKKIKNYESLFDDHQGLVHLEALEMLSRLCHIKLSNLNNSLTGEALKDMQETLEQVKELCELPEDDEEEKMSTEEFRETISNAVREINIPISYDKLFLTCEESDSWLTSRNVDFIDDIELHQQAIETMAQLTAIAVEQFHKAGELLLVKDHRSTADEADSLVQITTSLKMLIIGQAGKFTDKLSTLENANKDSISEHITNIFYEAANSGQYIQNAFQLLIPVLQVGAV